MDEKLIDILKQSSELFSKYGIRSITMDDLAREMGISKKTIYQFVENKADLVSKTMDIFLKEECHICDAIAAEHENAVEEMVEIARYVSSHFDKMKLSLIYDLQKYYRETWDLVEEHRNSYVYQVIKKNIEKGIKQDLYRKDLDAEIISKIYIHTSATFLDKEVFPSEQYNSKKVFLEYVRYHIHGITTDKGEAFLKEYLKRNKVYKHA